MYSYDTTIETINSYYDICKLCTDFEKGDPTPNDDDIFTVTHLEIRLAQSIIKEFGADLALKLGKVLVGSLE